MSGFTLSTYEGTDIPSVHDSRRGMGGMGGMGGAAATVAAAGPVLALIVAVLGHVDVVPFVTMGGGGSVMNLRGLEYIAPRTGTSAGTRSTTVASSDSDGDDDEGGTEGGKANPDVGHATLSSRSSPFRRPTSSPASSSPSSLSSLLASSSFHVDDATVVVDIFLGPGGSGSGDSSGSDDRGGSTSMPHSRQSRRHGTAPSLVPTLVPYLIDLPGEGGRHDGVGSSVVPDWDLRALSEPRNKRLLTDFIQRGLAPGLAPEEDQGGERDEAVVRQGDALEAVAGRVVVARCGNVLWASSSSASSSARFRLLFGRRGDEGV